MISRLSVFILSVFFLAACQPEVDQSNENVEESKTTVGMLQHIVYFYLNEDVTEEEKADFEEGLQKLLSIDEVYFYQIGTPGETAERDVTDHSFGYSISSWFQTMDDYMVYAEHPIHLEFIDEYSHLWADVKVFDSEVIVEAN
ncbi:MAG: Dabb family protein [Balneolaceae bacterium]